MQIPFGLVRAFGTMIVVSSVVWGAQSIQMWVGLPKELAGFLILVLTMLVIIPLQVVNVDTKSVKITAHKKSRNETKQDLKASSENLCPRYLLFISALKSSRVPRTAIAD